MKTAWMAIGAMLLAGMALRADTAPAPKAPASSLRAAPAIVSPDVQRTWPMGNLRGWSFRPGTDGKTFVVVATYANDLIADRENPQNQEDHWFRFPDVTYDRAARGFTWHPPGGGAPVLVAWRGAGSTALASNAIVVLFNYGGKLVATIKVAPPGTRFKTTLTQVTRGARWSLQGLIDR